MPVEHKPLVNVTPLRFNSIHKGYRDVNHVLSDNKLTTSNLSRIRLG